VNWILSAMTVAIMIAAIQGSALGEDAKGER
jgi:hypothetical protein